jgi:hypothetical protein
MTIRAGVWVALALIAGCDQNSRGNGNGGDDLAGAPTVDGMPANDQSIGPSDGGVTGPLDFAGFTGWDFDGGWQPPAAGSMPAANGNGAVTPLIGPGADGTSSGKFGGSVNAGASPSIVYPPSGVIVPPNMNALELHFIPASGQTLFKLTFTGPTSTLVVYTGCTAVGGGCVYATDSGFWTNLIPYARGTVPVTYTITGVNGTTPGSVGVSASRTITFSQQDLTGGIYYWNTAGAIERFDFGYPTVPAKPYITPPQAGALVCVGCHVVSRQGSLIAVGKDIPAPAPYTVFDVATTTAYSPAGAAIAGTSNFSSFSPDGNHLLTSDGAKIGWQELYTGSIVNPTVVSSGTMPDWSPDGSHMVYAKPNMSLPFGFPNPGVASASLETLHFNGLGWDTPATLVPYNGQNNYYPAYSPTGDWVIFNRSPSNANSFSNAAPDQDAGTAPDGELWVVPSLGGTAVRLDAANNPGNCAWPKWAPVVQDYYAGKLMWLTFSSDRAYGLRLATGAQTQLWMIGFDPSKASSGGDPSAPAFWLPFQDLTSGNHIAQWATQVIRKPCTMASQCASSETCRAGRCVPN